MTKSAVSGYEDARAVPADPRFSADATHESFPGLSPFVPPRGPGQFFVMDPPDHTRLRRTLIPDFTFRRIERLRPAVAGICADLLDAMTTDGATEADLVAAYALPQPTRVICALLGVPYDDHGFLHQQVRVLTDFASGRRDLMMAARQALYGYLGELLAARTREPADDLVSRLATGRVATGEISPEEAVGVAALLLIAGHETTANMFPPAVVTLLRHPEQLAVLRADAGLWPSAVEELLRYPTVAHQGMRRITTEDVELGGVRIRAGEGGVVALQAANRDPSVYEDPDAFDVRRDTSGQLAFGHGLHQCVGQSLARVELQIGLSVLFDRLPGLKLAAAEELPVSRSAIHGLGTLPVTW
ncbi:MAG: cytochrome P450 [Streptomyces sp.]|nr:cytochrome P450 [Streptomyces sp.]NUS16982.1 cytochrome P450 [Streptomyces sp.]